MDDQTQDGLSPTSDSGGGCPKRRETLDPCLPCARSGRKGAPHGPYEEEAISCLVPDKQEIARMRPVLVMIGAR